MRGLTARTVSAASPRRAITPGRNCSTRTSARSSSGRRRARSESCLRSRTSDFLPRFSIAKLTLSPPHLGTVAAHLLAARAFDLDHLGARLGEHQRRQRARQQGGEIEDQESVERRAHLLSERAAATLAARAGASPGWPLAANSAVQTAWCHGRARRARRARRDRRDSRGRAGRRGPCLPPSRARRRAGGAKRCISAAPAGRRCAPPGRRKPRRRARLPRTPRAPPPAPARPCWVGAPARRARTAGRRRCDSARSRERSSPPPPPPPRCGRRGTRCRARPGSRSSTGRARKGAPRRTITSASGTAAARNGSPSGKERLSPFRRIA